MTTLFLPRLHLSFFRNEVDGSIQQKINVEHFLEFLKENPDERFELVDGIIIPMSNASPTHGKIIVNFSSVIPNHLGNNNPCQYFSDMKCKIDNFSCPQPDFLVVCNDSVDSDLLKYPKIVGEVHSPSNRNNDFKKLARYKNCLSIQEILMIEQDEMKVTMHERIGHDWIESIYYQGDTIHLKSIDLKIDIAKIYERVKFA